MNHCQGFFRFARLTPFQPLSILRSAGRITLALLLVGGITLAFSSNTAAQNSRNLPDSLRYGANSAALAEGSLQHLLDSLGYDIDVAQDETGIETFCPPDGFNTATMILEVAGSAASAHSGYYEAGVPGNRFELFQPSDGPGTVKTFSVNPAIAMIGFYMEPYLDNPTTRWFSEHALNSDVFDHVWVFPAGDPKQFIIAFEDLPDGGDGDYQDLVIKVIFDYVPPTLSGCPTDITIDCNQSVPAPANVTATADCDPNPVITYNQTTYPGTCPQRYQLKRVWTVTDKWGGTASCTQWITVVDNTAPVLAGCPSNVTVECNNVPAPASPTATDNCDPSPTVSYNQTTTAGTCPQQYTLNRTWTATDACGNSSSCSQVITVQDTQAPVVTCPAPVTVQCLSLVPAPNTALVTAVDNCDASPTIVFVSDVSDGQTCPEKITRTYSATDHCGNSATCTQLITIMDTTPPVITSCPGAISVQCVANVPVPNPALVSATDNCDPNPAISFVSDVSDGQTCPETVTRTYKAMDACNNISYCTQIITVDDTTPPQITCPAPVTVQCMSQVPQPSPALCTATDNCDATPTVTFVSDVPSGSGCPMIITRTYKVTDDCGNEATCQQTITVNDQTPPQITCPGAVTVECYGDVPQPNPALCTATDNCDPTPTVVWISDTPQGSCPMTITRVYRATDDCGNQATCQQIITVDDNTLPQLVGCPANVGVSCGNIPAAANVTASDNCPGVTLAFSETTTPGSCPQAYTITRTWTATDACNNQAQCQQIITVTDNIAPQITCPNNVTVQCFGDVPQPTPAQCMVSDNCDPAPSVVFVSDVQHGSGCPLTITRTYSAMDHCGNTSSCEQTITVNDQTPPVLSGCPQNVTVNCGNVPQPANVTATDNCDVNVAVVFGEVTTPGNCVYNFIVTRTWTATDACGNVASCQQVITVQDVTPPQLTCPNGVTVECIGSVPQPNPTQCTVSDNCDPNPVVVWVSDVTGQQRCPALITRTYRATDACGNEATCTQTITVQDQTPPTFTTFPADQNIFQCQSTQICLPVAATDNCPGTVVLSVVNGGKGSIVGGQWCVTPTVTESYNVTIRAADTCGNYVDRTFHVDYRLNGAPTFTNCPQDARIHWGQTYTVDLNATDPDAGQTLTYSLCPGAPEGVTLNPTSGEVQFIAGAKDICTHTICVIVKDECNAADTCSFDLCVNNDPPAFANPLPPAVEQITWGSTYMFDFNAVDPDHGPYMFFYLSGFTYTGPAPEPLGILPPVVDPNTGVLTWNTGVQSPFGGGWDVTVQVTDSARVCDPCSPSNSAEFTFHIDVMILDQVQISKEEDVYLGQQREVYIDVTDESYFGTAIGGFDFLVQYDASAMMFMKADPGSFLTGCEWEYFTYRFGQNGNCGAGACPSGILRIVAMAETLGGNLGHHPACQWLVPHSRLVVLHFLVSSDATLECQFAPIRFIWYDCADNSISDSTGQQLFISDKVFDFVGYVGDPPEPVFEEILVQDTTFPTLTGAPRINDCDQPLPQFPTKHPIRMIYFRNGGLDIICADSIDAPGDINMNEIGYEIADAVMFTNYFIEGITAFADCTDLINDPLDENDPFEQCKEHQFGAIAASDTNKDGITLSVADLVFLIRVVVGDCLPYAKGTPMAVVPVDYSIEDGVVTVSGNVELGGAALIVRGEVTPQLLAPDMAMTYAFDGEMTRIVVTPPVEATSLHTFRGAFLGGISGEVVSLELATAEGAPVAAKNVPSRYELSQNYPNPFNPSTKINVALKGAGDYSLTIYNVQGQVVEVVRGSVAGPEHLEITWDASGLASGVYLYRLDAGQFSQTKKMLLLK